MCSSLGSDYTFSCFIWLSGADRDPEQLALTDQLLDAALSELACVAREQPCLLVGDFNVEPTKIPCLAKGIMAGLWVDLEASWALASGRSPGVTCKQDFQSSIGSRLDFMVGCPRVAAAVSGCEVLVDRWVVPHFSVRACFDYSRLLTRVSLPVQRSPLWSASWLPVLDKSRGSKAAEVQGGWEICYDRLQFMSRDDALGLDDSLTRGDVSSAWLIWSSAVEAALADAYRFAGGPVPENGLVMGRGVFRTRFVRLGGPNVRKARRNFADHHEGGDVSLYHDVSTSPLLGLRSRFRLVANLLSAMIRDGVSLARSVELAVQWDAILRVGPIPPLSDADFVLARVGDLGQCYQVALDLHRLSVVGRLLFVVGGIGCVRILSLILISGCALIWFRLLRFCSVILLLLLGVRGFCLTP